VTAQFLEHLGPDGRVQPRAPPPILAKF